MIAWSISLSLRLLRPALPFLLPCSVAANPESVAKTSSSSSSSSVDVAAEARPAADLGGVGGWAGSGEGGSSGSESGLGGSGGGVPPSPNRELGLDGSVGAVVAAVATVPQLRLRGETLSRQDKEEGGALVLSEAFISCLCWSFMTVRSCARSLRMGRTQSGVYGGEAAWGRVGVGGRLFLVLCWKTQRPSKSTVF